MTSKQSLRKQLIQKREDLSDILYVTYNQAITSSVLNYDLYKSAENVLIYSSINKEVSTLEIINDALSNNKNVYLPRIISKGLMRFYKIHSFEELKKGYMNILEPCGNDEFTKNSSSLSIIICPGVAFDIHCNRIGYGGGFYDRYLADNSLTSVALAYDFQVLNSIPTETHDYMVDSIITQAHIYIN